MERTTYTIPTKNTRYLKYEIEYIHSRNKLFFKVLNKKADFTTKTRSNTLKTLLEQSKGKYWYVLKDHFMIFQIHKIWISDKRMQELWSEEYLRILFGSNEEDKKQIREWFENIFNEFIEKVSKIEWSKIEYSE